MFTYGTEVEIIGDPFFANVTGRVIRRYQSGDEEAYYLVLIEEELGDRGKREFNASQLRAVKKK